MIKAQKFLFDNPFDGQGSSAGDPNDLYFDNEPKYGVRDIEKARDEAYAEGVTAGIQQSLASYESQMAATLNRIAEAGADLLRGRRQLAVELRQEAAQLALMIAAKLAPALMQDQPQKEIEALVAKCLIDNHDEPRIVIRLNPDQLEDLQQRILGLADQSGFAGDVVLLAEDEIVLGDCRLEWADGGVERDSGQLAQCAEEAVAKYLSTLTAPQAQEPPEQPEQQEPDSLDTAEPDQARQVEVKETE